MPRAAIFDLDGTLADTLADIATAMNLALASFGLPTHSLDAYRSFVGEGADVLAAKALPAERQDLKAEILERYVARYDEVYLDESVPYPGMLELLDGLAAENVKLAVLSNKPDPSTQKLVEALFRGRFAYVAGRKPDVPKKPDPTAALAIAAAFDVRPEDFLFVGDTAIDMQTAVAARMFPVGVAWGFRPEELERNGARAFVETPAAILPLLR